MKFNAPLNHRKSYCLLIALISPVSTEPVRRREETRQ